MYFRGQIIPTMNWKRTLGSALAFLFLSTTAFAQGRVTGSVKDGAGAALPGVVLSDEASGTTTTTDNNGLYSLTVSTNQVTMKASMMGYVDASKTVSLSKGAATANFILNEEAVTLDDIVVIGYGTSNIKDLTGSVVSVKAKSFQKGSFST
ncbi:MAG TPA: hypothetical protein DDY62_01110, partial [Cryomorphaceae bacterium]|nr:hypothetical protein [Cryomorphaceae bacterium]